MRKYNRKYGSQSGLAAVEFALTIVFVLFVVFWIFELMMFIYAYNVLANSAKEGVRYAVVHGCGSLLCSGPCTPACPSDPGHTQVDARVTTFAGLSFHDVSGITIDSNMYPDGSAASPNRVQVTVHYVYKPFFSLGWNPPTIYATAQGRILN